MKKNKKLYFRLVTILCCIAVMCGSVFPSVVMGLALGYEEDTSITSSQISGLSATNLLTGLSPKVTGITETGSSTNWRDMLTDGKSFSIKLNEAKNATLTYELPTSYQINSFILWQGSSKQEKKVSYEIYISENEGSLYSSSALVYSWDAFKDKKSMGQKADFTLKPCGKYIGIKFTETCSDKCDKSSADHLIATVTEIGAWGVVNDKEYTVSSSTDHSKIAGLYATNIIKDKLPIAAGGIAGGSSDWQTNLTNGLDASVNDIYCNENQRIFLTYSLNSLYSLDTFALWNKTGGRGVSYDVYVGNDKDKLYDGEPVCVWTADGVSTEQIFSFNKKPQGIYLGILITSPSSTPGDLIARIVEIGVWGKETHGATVNNTLSLADIPSNYETNLLNGLSPESTTVSSGSKDWKKGLSDGKSDSVTLNDADSATITYKLNKRMKITALALWNGSAQSVHRVSYAVYASVSKNQLYDAEPIFTYDASADSDSVAQKINFSEFNLPIAKYFGIKIINSCSDNCDKSDVSHKNAELAEIQAWGILDDVVFDNSITASDIKPMSYTSVLKGLKPENTLLGSAELADKITNAEADNDIYIQNAVGVGIIFKLPMTTAIDKIALWNAKDKYIGYDVFISSSDANIFSGEPAYSVTLEEQGKNLCEYASFPNGGSVSGKYIGIKITETTDKDGKAYISEIAAYGKQDFAEIVDTDLTIDDIVERYDSNLIVGLKPNTTITGDTSKLADGNGASQDYSNAKNASFTYVLPYTTKITSFAFLSGQKGLKVSYELYVGNSMSTLYSREPAFVWNVKDNPASQGQLVTFPQSVQPVGIYIGIKITDTGAGDPYNIARIGEIGLWGVQTADVTDPIIAGLNTDVTPDDVLLWDNENLLAGTTYHLALADGRITEKGTDELTDGIAGPNKHKDIYDTKNAKLTYDLNRSVDISAFMLYQIHNSNTLRISYKVFIGDDFSKLYSGEPVFVWNSQDNLSSNGQKITFSENDIKRGRYVGIYITETCSDGCKKEDSNHLMSRICEIGVYGTPDFSQEVKNNVSSGISDAQIADAHSENLLVGIAPQILSRAEDERQISNIDLLTDGLTNGDALISNAVSNKIIYTVKRSADITGMLMSASSAIGGYEVYMSDSLANLFDYKNEVVEYKANDANDLTQFINISKESVNYLGIKIVKPSIENAYDVLINEIALYGQLKKYNTAFPESSIEKTPYDAQNILKNKQVSVKYLDGKDVLYDSKRGKFERYTDGKTGPIDHQDIYDANKGITITYSLVDKYTIDILALYNTRALVQQAYEIYVGNSASTLYNPNNLVVSYRNTSYTWAQEFFLAGDTEVSGKYIGFRFPTPNFVGDGDLRVNELVAVGSLYIPKDVNIANTASVKAYSYMQGKISDITFKELSQAEQLRFVDETNRDPVSVYSDGVVSFVIDLCAKMNISQFTLGINNLKAFNIYVADTEAELWITPKLAVKYSENASKGVTLDATVSCRFIRLEVIDTQTRGSVFINSFSAIGLDVQKLDIDNQLYNMPYNNVKLLAQNKGDHSYKVLADFYNYKYIVDNYTNFGASFGGAEYGKETLNLVFKFDSLKMLRSVIINTLGTEDLKTGNVKVYISDSMSSVMASNINPVYDYTYKSADATNTELKLDFSPTAGMYLRISFDGSCSKKYAPEAMMAVVTEIKAMGIECKNTLPANDDGKTALYIEDKKSGISFRVERLFADDILTSINKLTVERIEPTSKQKSLLRDEGFELLGAMYKLHLYDYLGREVTEFGGRKIDVSIPLPKDIAIAYLAGYSSDRFGVVNAGYVDENICYSFTETGVKLDFGIVTIATIIDETKDSSQGDKEEGDSEENTLTENEDVNTKDKNPNDKIDISGKNKDNRNIYIIIASAVVMVIVAVIVIIIAKNKKGANLK